ncbi:hypothetical protein GE21DRAFT_1114700 [Neurospora crassa]|nr:hypothetical protein GE21DRAFT_1114700 [Neurospora crassa]
MFPCPLYIITFTRCLSEILGLRLKVTHTHTANFSSTAIFPHFHAMFSLDDTHSRRHCGHNMNQHFARQTSPGVREYRKVIHIHV